MCQYLGQIGTYEHGNCLNYLVFIKYYDILNIDLLDDILCI